MDAAGADWRMNLYSNAAHSFTNPAAGTWFVMIRGFTAYTGVSIKGTYSVVVDNTPALTNGVPVTGISGATNSQPPVCPSACRPSV